MLIFTIIMNIFLYDGFLYDNDVFFYCVVIPYAIILRILSETENDRNITGTEKERKKHSHLY